MINKHTELIEQVTRHEGYRSKPYQDTVGVWTFGHGLTYITEEESEIVVSLRLFQIEKVLKDKIGWLSYNRQAVLLNMAYNLGIAKLNKFVNMWDAIYRRDCDDVGKEMFDSKWARQVGYRAEELVQQWMEG